MTEPAENDVSIEDLPSRCWEKFPDGNQCWNAAVKVVRFRGETRVMCSPHFERWVEKIIQTVGKVDL